jgi:FtsH-binding integral membrane protein
MTLTTAGQTFLASSAAFLVAAIWLGRRVSQRSQPGKGTSTLVVVILFALIALFVPFSYWTGQALYAFASKPSYSVTVVGHTSEYRSYDEEDANGRSVTRQRLMHTAQVRFIGPEGVALEMPNSVASSEIPVDGEEWTVVYAPGDRVASELSVRSVGLWLAASVMLFMLGYCLWATVRYAQGHSMEGVLAFGMAFLFRFLLPVTTLLMAGALGYSALKYFAFGNPDGYPFWVACLCTLFTLALLPLLVTLFRPNKSEDE